MPVEIARLGAFKEAEDAATAACGLDSVDNNDDRRLRRRWWRWKWRKRGNHPVGLVDRHDAQHGVGLVCGAVSQWDSELRHQCCATIQSERLVGCQPDGYAELRHRGLHRLARYNLLPRSA